MKKIIIILGVALCAVLACTKEPYVYRNGGRITPFVYSQATKAAESTDDTLENRGFKMLAYLDSAYYSVQGETTTKPAGIYIDSADVTYSSNGWVVSGDPTPTWVILDSMRFWCWTPIKKGSLTLNPLGTDMTGKDTLRFHYTMPAAVDTSVTHAAYCDATNQDDILFAYNCVYKTSASADDRLDLRFHHALSRINFIVYPLAQGSQTTNDGSFRTDYTIVDIALHDIMSDGDCVIKGMPDPEKSNIDSTVFTWSNQNTPSNFTQNYNFKFDSVNFSVPSGWIKKDYSGKAHYYCNNSFFIVPQEIGATASLAVTFKNKGDSLVTKSVGLRGVGTATAGGSAVTEWKSGYRYTYRLAISTDIVKKLEDNFSVSLVGWTSATEEENFRF